jgi:hypothetical protein
MIVKAVPSKHINGNKYSLRTKLKNSSVLDNLVKGPNLLHVNIVVIYILML